LPKGVAKGVVQGVAQRCCPELYILWPFRSLATFANISYYISMSCLRSALSSISLRELSYTEQSSQASITESYQQYNSVISRIADAVRLPFISLSLIEDYALENVIESAQEEPSRLTPLVKIKFFSLFQQHPWNFSIAGIVAAYKILHITCDYENHRLFTNILAPRICERIESFSLSQLIAVANYTPVPQPTTNVSTSIVLIAVQEELLRAVNAKLNQCSLHQLVCLLRVFDRNQLFTCDIFRVIEDRLLENNYALLTEGNALVLEFLHSLFESRVFSKHALSDAIIARLYS